MSNLDRYYERLDDAVARGEITDAEARDEWFGELEDQAERMREDWR